MQKLTITLTLAHIVWIQKEWYIHSVDYEEMLNNCGDSYEIIQTKIRCIYVTHLMLISSETLSMMLISSYWHVAISQITFQYQWVKILQIDSTVKLSFSELVTTNLKWTINAESSFERAQTIRTLSVSHYCATLPRKVLIIAMVVKLSTYTVLGWVIVFQQHQQLWVLSDCLILKLIQSNYTTLILDRLLLTIYHLSSPWNRFWVIHDSETLINEIELELWRKRSLIMHRWFMSSGP